MVLCISISHSSDSAVLCIPCLKHLWRHAQRYYLLFQSHRVTLWLAVYRQSVRLGDKPLEISTSNFLFRLNTCGHSPYVSSSLTRGWVCCLQLLLVLASVVILRSEATFYCLRFESPPTWRVPFSSTRTTCRASVGVFDPTSTRD
jgi:hypothetical protein